MNEGRSFWSTPEEWIMLIMVKIHEGLIQTLAFYHRLTSAKKLGEKEERLIKNVQYWLFLWPIEPAYRRWRTTGTIRQPNR